MRDLCFSYYTNHTDTVGEQICLSWSSWCELFSEHEQRDEKNGPAILLGTLPPGARRAGKNVTRVDALALDLDSIPDEQVIETMRALEEFEYFWWTTHKHGTSAANGQARIRIVLPLAEALDPTSHLSAWLGLNHLVGGVNDKSTKDIGRLHYLPSTPDLALAERDHHAGRWLTLADLPAAAVAVVPVTSSDSITVFETINTIKQKMARWPADDLKPAMKALIKGELFAEEGTRHDTMTKLTMWIALQHPDLAPKEAIVGLFRSSLAKMGSDTLEAVWNAYKSGHDKVIVFRKNRTRQAQQRARPYEDDDYIRIARANGWEPEDLQGRWAIEHNGGAWFLTETGNYSRYTHSPGLTMAIEHHLSRTTVRLFEPPSSTRSVNRYRANMDVIREVGTPAEKVMLDMTLQRTTFDPVTRTLHDARCPLRPLEPKFNSMLDEWLRLATGKDYEKFCDWMACAPDLNKPLCAILFYGPRSTGKTLFATGLAKLWTDGAPTPVKKGISKFNADLLRCPILLADEHLPKSSYSDVTGDLRSIVSIKNHTIEEKFKEVQSVYGAIRLIIATNSKNPFDTSTMSGAFDVEAIAERFLYIDVPPAAAEFLDSYPSQDREQLAIDGIARHALHLQQVREVVHPSGKFWVSGDIAEMHLRLVTSHDWTSKVIEWLVTYLGNPHGFFSGKSDLNQFIRIQDNELLVNVKAITMGWDLVFKNEYRNPPTKEINNALKTITKPETQRYLRTGMKRNHHRVIDPKFLISWANETDYADEEDILNAIATGEALPGPVISRDYDKRYN